MHDAYKAMILRTLQDDRYVPMKLSRLAKELQIGDEEYGPFREAFDQMCSDGQLVVSKRNLMELKPIGKEVEGTFRANAKGFGFVVASLPNAHGDLFIPPDQVADAMDGDTVVAKVLKKGKREGQMRLTGLIVQIKERARHTFVGTLVKHEDTWLVQPDGTAFVDPIVVEDVTAKNAHLNDKVVVEILDYPSQRYLAHGVILEVLGKAGLYESEIQSVIHQFHLPGDFDEGCFDQARAAAESYDIPERYDSARVSNETMPLYKQNPRGQEVQPICEETKDDGGGGREDICDMVIVTIDPPDAKDFDDAISIERDDQGNWVLGVHIADVSHFIEMESPLDMEAKERGNSVYLPGRTIPMLPEILSNGICSLQPNQKRFTKSVYITYDDEGKILSSRFANSVICSSQRLTYLQANGILEGAPHDLSPEVVQLVKDMDALARRIEERRVKNGMLHLDMTEIDLVMDDEGKVVDAEPADDCYPHTIIEMFMVEANDAVAGLLDRLNVPFMRRIHPDPSPMSFKSLKRLLKGFGIALPPQPDRFVIQSLLNSVKDTESSLAVNIAVLRSFEKAVYSPLNIGHYALASRHYCHFTSPIRRYADLMVHRMLQHHLENRMDRAKQDAAMLNLTEIGTHISTTERNAEDAERDLKAVLILQLLSTRLGEDLDCVVTGLTKFGVFVQCRKFGVEGLIRIEDLGSDHWNFDDRTHTMTGERSGVAVRLGQPIKVRIASVNVPARQLNVVPSEPLSQGKGKKKSKKHSKDKQKKKHRTPKKHKSGKKRRK